MNEGIGTVTALFHFWEYLFRIFSILSLQCTDKYGTKLPYVKKASHFLRCLSHSIMKKVVVSIALLHGKKLCMQSYLWNVVGEESVGYSFFRFCRQRVRSNRGGII
jgi:hypothetical protein